MVVTKLSRPLQLAVVIICITPLLLTLLGVDFGTYSEPLASGDLGLLADHELVDALFYSLSGAFVHTLLEWSAFMTAIFIFFLALNHYRLTGNYTTAIIGVALLFSGAMDAFHTLAADRLIETVADNRNLIPFTWAICRLFNALIMIAGVGLLLVGRIKPRGEGVRFLVVTSVVIGLIAYAIIHYSAVQAILPNTQFHDNPLLGFITRPYDVVPLVLYLFLGLYIYPRFYQRVPSVFSHALIISIIPHVTTQAHMAFGSSMLFDNHFNIAHFLKIMAYLVPFVGLVLDHITTYRTAEKAVDRLTTEVAERREFEKALAESEARSRAIVNTAVSGILVIDEEGLIEEFNQGAEAIFGYQAQEIIGRNVTQLMSADIGREHRGYLQRYLKTGEAHIIGIGREILGVRRDSSTVPLHLSVSEIRLEDRVLFVGFLMDISERVKAEEKLSDYAQKLELNAMVLEGALQEAEEATRAKSEFLANMSHELRTPLNSVIGFANVLAKNKGGHLKAKDLTFIERITENGRHLLNLINDVLDLSKIEAGRMQLEMAPVSLDVVIGGVIAQMEGQVKHKPLKLESEIPSELTPVAADEFRLKQVLINLVGNAIKFTEKGNITIRVHTGPENASPERIDVVDTGVGIPADRLEKIFGAFLQADSGTARKYGGTGLGLAISRSLCQAMGFEIGVHSEVGVGTTFSIHLIPTEKAEP